MRALVSNIVTEDYVVYAELAGVDAAAHPALLRHAQRAGAAGHRAWRCRSARIFNGAIITEQVFGYPGLGSLLVGAVYAGDYSLVLGRHRRCRSSPCRRRCLLIDMLYPLLDPRVQAGMSMLTILRDLLRYNLRVRRRRAR